MWLYFLQSSLSAAGFAGDRRGGTSYLLDGGGAAPTARRWSHLQTAATAAAKPREGAASFLTSARAVATARRWSYPHAADDAAVLRDSTACFFDGTACFFDSARGAITVRRWSPPLAPSPSATCSAARRRRRPGRSVGRPESGRTAAPPAGRVGRSGAPTPKFASPRCARRVGRSDVPSRKRLISKKWVGRAIRKVHFQLGAAAVQLQRRLVGLGVVVVREPLSPERQPGRVRPVSRSG